MAKRVLLVCASALFVGCGYVGDPLPPALNIPEKIKDLHAIERGDKLIIEFTAPGLTTEGLAIRQLASVDLRLGILPAQFSLDAWASGAAPVPVTALPEKPVRVEVPVQNWIGREILLAVRSSTPKRRPSDWSNTVTMTIRQPLPPPAEVRAEPHPEGVRVFWRAPEDGLSYRVYRQAGDQKKPELAGTVQANEFIDRAAAIGRPYAYTVQASGGTAESELSQAATVVPRDVFPPGTPTGVNAVAGINSIELAWDRNTEPDLRGYRVYRSTGQGEFAVLTDFLETPAYSDRQITSGTAYRYQITAVDQSGNESGKSVPVEVTAQ